MFFIFDSKTKVASCQFAFHDFGRKISNQYLVDISTNQFVKKVDKRKLCIISETKEGSAGATFQGIN
jgi:hypothetical protein